MSLASLVEDDPLLWEVIERAPGHDRWMEQVAHTGYCEHPIRLSGRIAQVDKASGEIREVYSTEDEPDATLLKKCGNRRDSRCRSCAAEYRGDTYQLVLAGLRGGRKGVPESVAWHPKLFVTLTAPSFGAVHSRRTRGHRLLHCHPRQGNPRCPHGRPASCWQLHLEGDPRLGEPLCAECFDYEAQVLWNALCPELWRYTRMDIPRALAGIMGLKVTELERLVRFDYCKVAELQLRGALHFHIVMRLDARPPRGDSEQVAPPPDDFTPQLFEEAVRLSHARIEAPHPRISRDRPAGY
ncbi:MAG: replication initiator, partial [Actinomycetota bacterium]